MSFLQARLRSPEQFAAMQQKLRLRRESNERYVAICGDTGCAAWGSKNIRAVFQEKLDNLGVKEIAIRFTGCLGLCEYGPIVVVFPGEIFYQRVKEDDVEEILRETFLKGKVIQRLLYEDPLSDKKYVRASEIPFYRGQKRLLLGKHWKIDPVRIEDYLAIGGYSAAVEAFSGLDREQIIEEVKKSRLRGRGGAGFPAGLKWQECYETPADKKYIICNADEGDPGAFMDRSILEGNPHSILEGLLVGGYAVGAEEGLIYVRAEYPTAVEKLKLAISQAEELGLLGDNILDTGFHFKVSLSIGAGAFVCGETSALVASVEGRVGEPRQKPPHLAENGLWGKPTVINNAETLANVPLIFRLGSEGYGRIGTENSRGTKIFSLVGKVNNTGLVEVPLGMTLREIIFDIGGGIKEGKKFKAVQTGGPSGGCLPESLLDLPTDYEDLNASGSMMGSGGMIVMDEDTCMVDVARYFLRFLKDESCGKCFSCREGIGRMLELIDDICEGTGSPGHLEFLQEVARAVKDSTMCGLGQTSVNPVLSTIRYFEDEYRAHIEESRCPAGVCKDLIRFEIDKELCNGCGACLKSCPAEAIEGERKKPHGILDWKCTRCGICLETCAQGAVLKK